MKFRLGPWQLTILEVQNRHAGEQKSHWDKTNEGNYHLKLCMPFVGLAPVRLLQLVLRSYPEVFPNCNTVVDVRLY